MEKNYVPAIDGMRAVAIAIVVASHFGAEHFVPGGFGVTLFFFISGYLITELLIQEHGSTGKIEIGSFYLRRFLRLGPALIAMIIAVSLFYFLLFGSISWSEICAAIFYYTNYYVIYGGAVPLPFGPLWSLAVEEHYYLAYPLLFAVTWKYRRSFLLGLLALTIAVLTWRIVLVFCFHAPEIRTYVATDTRIDSIIYGAILSSALNTHHAWFSAYCERWWVTVLAIVALLISFIYRDAIFRETFRYSLQGVALIPLFYSTLRAQRFSIARRILESGPLIWIGRLSYSIYLWHFSVMSITKEMTENAAAVPMINLAASLVMASISYYFVEGYFLKVRAYYRNQTRRGPLATNRLPPRLVP